MTPKQALDIEFECHDLDQTLTFREYFVEILQTLFWKEEAFSGKRPFGNSGWLTELSDILRENGVTGDLYEFFQLMIAELGEPWGE
jgi:hypothetical protein